MGKKETDESIRKVRRTTLRYPRRGHRVSLVGDRKRAAEHVSFQGYRVNDSDVDFLRDLDRIIDLDAEIPHRALDLRVPEEQLNCAEIAGSPIDKHGPRAS